MAETEMPLNRRRDPMTDLERHLVAVVQEMERSYGEREKILNERLATLTKQLNALSGLVEALSRQVASLSEVLNGREGNDGNGSLLIG
jgi:ABC-type transporter Mla subunit MlaD